MAELNGLIAEQLYLFVGGIAIIMIIFLIIAIVQAVKLSKMRKRYNQMMAGSGVENLETLLLDLKLQMDSIEDDEQNKRDRFQAIEHRLRQVPAHIGMKRYNAFSEHGSDLSFSLAILNDESDGVILTGLHNRDSSYMYAKPIVKSESTYNLSPEEKEAIQLAKSPASTKI